MKLELDTLSGSLNSILEQVGNFVLNSELECCITVEETKDLRSLELNKYYWKIIIEGIVKTGNVNASKLVIHEYLKRLYLSHSEIVTVPIWTCQECYQSFNSSVNTCSRCNSGSSYITKEFVKKEMVVNQSTADLSTHEFMCYLDKCKDHLCELGGSINEDYRRD